MLEALKIQFGRAVKEYAEWRAVPDHERSDAPAWWWGTAMDALGQQAAMPPEWCSILGVRAGTSFAEGALVLMAPIVRQTHSPWPSEFPRKFGQRGPIRSAKDMGA